MSRNVFLSLAVCALAISLRLPTLHKIRPDAFGAECESVAKSLMRGDGWSDAYGPGTGPTAHVSPIYPLLLHSLYRVFGAYDTPTGRLAQQYCSLGVAVLVILLLPAIARNWDFPQSSVGAALSCRLASRTSLASCDGLRAEFGRPHHAWIDLGLRDLARGRLAKPPYACCTTGVTSGIGGLGVSHAAARVRSSGSPSSSFAAAVNDGRSQSGSLVIVMVSAFIVAPWAISQRRVLGGFVPFRSNFGLELAIGNRLWRQWPYLCSGLLRPPSARQCGGTRSPHSHRRGRLHEGTTTTSLGMDRQSPNRLRRPDASTRVSLLVFAEREVVQPVAAADVRVSHLRPARSLSHP